MAEYDYIITGGGSAGCVLAHRLSEDPSVTVLLLEAGGRDRHPFFHIPAGFAKMTKGIASWGWSTVPQKHMNDRVLWYTQAKVIGGGSTINAQIYTRGNAGDYDAWADEENCAGWRYADVLPYFRRGEDNQRFDNAYHGSGGPLGVAVPSAALPICDAFIRGAQQMGLPFNPDFNGARPDGFGFYQVTQKDGRRSSTATGYLKQAADRPNLTVRTGIVATRILVEKGRATGVEFGPADGGATETAHAALEVLVTSGAIGSPKLLLQSGIGPADHLKSVGVDPVHDLPGVGENLHDHLDLFIICECTGPHTYDAYAKPHKTAMAGLQYLMFRNGPASSSLFETGGFWYSSDDRAWPDLQFHFGQGTGIEAGVAKMKNAGVTLNAAYVRPKSRGTVRLQSDDPAAHPLIDPNYWSEPEDWTRALAGLRMARELLQQEAMAPYVQAERLPGPDIQTDDDFFAYATANAKTQHHPVGACKMGTDAMAVVDPELKVHGLEGLRVCDSSIIPRVNSSNTNAPTIMIGEKASDMIRGLEPLPPTNLPERATRARIGDPA